MLGVCLGHQALGDGVRRDGQRTPRAHARQDQPGAPRRRRRPGRAAVAVHRHPLPLARRRRRRPCPTSWRSPAAPARGVVMALRHRELPLTASSSTPSRCSPRAVTGCSRTGSRCAATPAPPPARTAWRRWCRQLPPTTCGGIDTSASCGEVSWSPTAREGGRALGSVSRCALVLCDADHVTAPVFTSVPARGFWAMTTPGVVVAVLLRLCDDGEPAAVAASPRHCPAAEGRPAPRVARPAKSRSTVDPGRPAPASGLVRSPRSGRPVALGRSTLPSDQVRPSISASASSWERPTTVRHRDLIRCTGYGEVTVLPAAASVAAAGSAGGPCRVLVLSSSGSPGPTVRPASRIAAWPAPAAARPAGTGTGPGATPTVGITVDPGSDQVLTAGSWRQHDADPASLVVGCSTGVPVTRLAPFVSGSRRIRRGADDVGDASLLGRRRHGTRGMPISAATARMATAASAELAPTSCRAISAFERRLVRRLGPAPWRWRTRPPPGRLSCVAADASPAAATGSPAAAGARRRRGSRPRSGSARRRSLASDLQTIPSTSRGMPGSSCRRRGRLLPDVLVGDRHRRVAHERRPSGQQLEEQAARRVEVAARVHLLAARLLGREVLRGADHRRRLRHRRRRVRQRAGDAEVHDLDVAGRREHDVGRLDVPVDDARAVAVLERVEHAGDDLERELDGEPAPARAARRAACGPRRTP